MTDSELQLPERHNNSAMDEFYILKEISSRELDELSVLAAQVCETVIAGILVVEQEKNWLKSFSGAPKDNFPIQDPLWKERLRENCFLEYTESDLQSFSEKSTGSVSFFAANPLTTAEGRRLGFLFVADRDPKNLRSEQKEALKILSRQILQLLEYQKQQNKLIAVKKKLEQRYRELEKFSSVVSHDIKSPLANIISLTELLQEENKDIFDEETRQYLNFLTQSSYSLRNYVDGILTFYRSEKILEQEEEDVDLSTFFKKITDLYLVNRDVEISYPPGGTLRKVNKAALTQIFLNLISNALKYNSRSHRWVEITFAEKALYYEFEVRDNGNGIPQWDYEKIFELFTTLDLHDREGNPGSGIGLATVKKLLEHMGGTIEVESQIGEGSTFRFWIRKAGKNPG